MALFGMQIRSRRKAGMGGFHAEYLNDRTAIRQRKQMGYLRSIFTALSLLFGGFMVYVALHYIPAFVQPKAVLKFATGDSAASKTYDFERHSTFHKIFGPYVKIFQIDRAYMQSGQAIQIKYDLPKGASAKLDIIQCQRAWIVEIFNCKIINTHTTRTNLRSGIESFSLKQGGFYHFRQDVINVPEGEEYRIVWERG